jgi:hypothetical protein
MGTLSIQYNFTLADGSKENFSLAINDNTIELIDFAPKNLPDWTRLDFHKCPHCPFDSASTPYCPVAKNLVPIVTLFEKLLSYDEIYVEVVTKERTMAQDTTAQRAISALMGLVIAASGCPHTSYFKPMARFHLPFASEKETLYRATSMYLLAQYFLKKEGYDFDLDLKGLTEIYKNIQKVNMTISERIRSSSVTDSSVNAIVLLDMYAKAIPYVIKDHLEDIRYLFSSFLPKK